MLRKLLCYLGFHTYKKWKRAESYVQLKHDPLYSYCEHCKKMKILYA